MIDIIKLKEGEEGERVNLKTVYKWLIHDMSYEDFRAFTTLHCRETNLGYNFKYKYMVNKENDTPERREDYLKYFMYKLVQNTETPNVELLENIS